MRMSTSASRSSTCAIRLSASWNPSRSRWVPRLVSGAGKGAQIVLISNASMEMPTVGSIQLDSWSFLLLIRCGLPDPPCPNTATKSSSSPTTFRSNASATCLLMKVQQLPPSTKRSPSFFLCGVVMTTRAVLQRWVSSSCVEATWMVTFLRLVGGWWDFSVSSGHSAWWLLPLLHCLQVGVGESQFSVLWLALVQISHLPFFMKIFRFSARVGTLMQALAKWPVSSQKKQLLGRRPWLLGERALVALVDLEPWEVANLAIRYASVTVCATSLFQSSCKSLSVLDLATYTMEEGVDRPVACLSYIPPRQS